MKRCIFLALAIAYILLIITACKPVKDPPEEDPNITITYCRVMSLKDRQALLGEGETIDDNVWTKAYKDCGKIILKLAFSDDNEKSYVQAIINKINSGEELPDIIYIPDGEIGKKLLNYLYGADVLQDLSIIYNEYDYLYVSDEMKIYFENAGEEVFMPVTIDGKLMAIPQVAGGENKANCLYWIRRDWLDVLELNVPDTMEEFYEVLKQFTISDPDCNKVNDTYGMVLGSPVAQTGSLFFNAFGSYPKTWLKGEDGKLHYGSLTPETKQALAELNKLYKDGYISDPSQFGSEEAVIQEMLASKAGVLIGNVRSPFSLEQLFTNNMDADLIPAYAISADEKPLKITAPLNVSGYFAVNRNFEHPEMFLKMLKLYINVLEKNELTIIYDRHEDYIDNGFTLTRLSQTSSLLKEKKEVYNKYIYSEDGKGIFNLALISAEMPGYSLNRAKNISAALKSTIEPEYAADNTFYNYILKYLNDGTKNFWAWNKIYGEKGSAGMLEKYFQDDLFLISKYNSAYTPSMALYQEDLDNLEETVFTDIITGKKPVDYFDTFVKQWLATGGGEIIHEINEWINDYEN